MTEKLRIFCEQLVQALPLPSKAGGIYFLLHCRLAGWAMFLGEPVCHPDNADLPF